MQNELTPQETIIELNRCKVNGYMPTDWDRRCRAIEAAKAALEKQIPQKPKHEEFKDGSSVVKCPICDTSEGVCNYNPHFCPECGQALDWGDV